MKSIFGWSYPPGCNGPPEDDAYSCVVCSVEIPKNQIYCGVSCAIAEEEGTVDYDWSTYVREWPMVLARLRGESEG